MHRDPPSKSLLLDLFSIWKTKDIYDDEYVDGLIFVLNCPDPTLLTIPLHLLGHDNLREDCFRYGLPVNKHALAYLAGYLRAKNNLYPQEKPKFSEGPYDGLPLSDEDLTKIKNNSVKIVTYHPLGDLQN